MARKILLADDSVTAQNMGRKILTDAGYDVITVNNGSAALKKVAEQKPDLIVLDVYMPGYSGLEVCARLKDAGDTSRIPILLTVGKLEPFKPEEATRVRADAFIIKPFEASELLSVLTRLEDRMVPAQAEGARFSGSVSGVERFNGGDPAVKKSEGESETGWKNRLRFPSKKKKEEPEPEPEPDFVTPSSFRDFRRGGKGPGAAVPLGAESAAAQGPTIVPDIPRDITPEELDALSELAAKLDGVPANGQVAPTEVAAVAAAEPPAPPVVPQEAVPETKVEAQTPAAIVEEVRNSFEVSPALAETAAADAVEAPQFSASAPETEPPAASYRTEPAIAQEPAPIDREDEPAFATAALTSPESAEQTPVASDVAVPAEHAEESQADEVKPAASELVADAPAIAASAPEVPVSEPSSPSAEELAEALRFLTPAPSPEVPQSLAEAGAALARELSEGAAGRWVAEAVALSPEEAAGSLEAEMFRSFSQGSTGFASDASTTAVDQNVDAVASAPAEQISVAAVAETSVEPQPAVPSAPSMEEAPEESVGATTFADAVRDQDDREEPRVAAAHAIDDAARNELESSAQNEPGGDEAMGKENKGKGGKSTWHEINPGVPASADSVEKAKQSEEPRTMAAAAASDSSTDASHIANIVDSVLADLRPKIVEEIAKQLSRNK